MLFCPWIQRRHDINPCCSKSLVIEEKISFGKIIRISNSLLRVPSYLQDNDSMASTAQITIQCPYMAKIPKAKMRLRFQASKYNRQ